MHETKKRLALVEAAVRVVKLSSLGFDRILSFFLPLSCSLVIAGFSVFLSIACVPSLSC